MEKAQHITKLERNSEGAYKVDIKHEVGKQSLHKEMPYTDSVSQMPSSDVNAWATPSRENSVLLYSITHANREVIRLC